jgi:heme A synthase
LSSSGALGVGAVLTLVLVLAHNLTAAMLLVALATLNARRCMRHTGAT